MGFLFFRKYVFTTICLVATFFCAHAYAQTAETLFYRGQACYLKLKKDPERIKYRENWFPCIDDFRKAFQMNPRGPFAAASLYYAGNMYKELSAISGLASDRDEALDYFERILKRFEKSRYIQKARKQLSSMMDTKKENRPPEKDVTKVKKIHRDPTFTESKAKYKKRNVKKPLIVKNVEPPENSEDISPKEFTTINALKYWSNPNYSRIVVSANQHVKYDSNMLENNPDKKTPHRLFLDFKNSRLKKGIDKKLPINDNLLIDTRAGQYTPDSVRVVIDIKSFENYRIFSQEDPFRVVVDVWGKALRKKENEKKGTVPEKTIHPAVRKTKQKEPGSDLIRQLSLGVSRIVIDPGHGGRDAGAVGYNDKILEKDVVLHIAKTLARRIRKRIGCEVILTRQTDRFLSLEERTAIANTREADLFISVHTNAHKDKRAYGIETYHLDLATDEEAVRVAAMENATSKNNISDLEKILAGLMQNANQNESGILASLVQNSMCERLEKRYKRIRNKGVKEAPFYVLMGARMPSVLIETSFISNRRECNRLTNSTYVNNLCEGIVEGIIRYIKETKPTALKGGNQNFGG